MASAVAVWPLVAGTRTLYLRDVLNTHYPMKWLAAQALSEGRVPLVDAARGGGQAHAGNPNTVAFYPDNVLYLVADPLWALNAHFWLHLLVAPLAGFLLGRGWGLRREAAWTVGVVYAASGYYLAQLNLYNLVAPVTLAPALVGAALRLGEARRPGGWLAALAFLWALAILGGDPITALLAFVLALGAVLLRYGRRYRWGAAAWGLACGTLIAAPQWIEFLRILKLSYRGYWGYSPQAALVSSLHPLALVELLVPFPFGRPDLHFWGFGFYGGFVPLVFSLFPGVLTLALAGVAPWRGRGALWAWLAILLGVGAALGPFNPVLAWLVRLPGAGLFRLPIKFWLAAAMGGSLLAGLGAAALFEEGGRLRLRRALLALVLGYLAAWALLTTAPIRAEAVFRRLIHVSFPAEFVSLERVRWAGTCLLVLAVLALLLGSLALGRRRPVVLLALLLAVHAGSQFFLLRPLLATDAVAPYRERPSLAAAVPSGSRVVFGEHNGLFGSLKLDARAYPDGTLVWPGRTLQSALHPSSGVRQGLRYDFDVSPEGLDSFLSQITAQTIMERTDAERLRLLRVAGVEYLTLTRDLGPEALAAVPAEEVARREVFGGSVRLYRLLDPAPPVILAGEVEGAGSMNAALDALLDEGFDPRRHAILAGTFPRRSGPPGTARLVGEEEEALEVDVDSEAGGALVVQRTYLPIYRATVDGRPARLVAANLHRMAMLVDPGPHRVRIWVERRSLLAGAALALLGLAGSFGGARRANRRPAARPEAPG